MLKAIIFDLDGVIAKTMHLHWEAEKLTLKRYGVLSSSEELDSYSGKSIAFKFSEILKKHGKEANFDDVLKMHTSEGYEYIVNNLMPVAGVIELVKQAHEHKLKIGLASGSPLIFIKGVLGKLGILKFFDSVISVDDITHGKPHPEIFLKSAEALGVKPSECIVMEDAPQGIEAAKRAGMKCFAVTTTFQREDRKSVV